MGELFLKTIERKHFFESKGYKYVSVWECEFDAKIKEDSEIRAFVESLDYKTPLVPRDALFGGRVNAIKLFHEIGPGEVIKYLDLKSLYPFVNKWCKYPLFHPKVITQNFGAVEDYKGLIKCSVVPPRGELLPCLPYRTQGKLTFPLCRTCVESKEQIIGKCTHSDLQRELHGTWCSNELHLAIELGYKVTSIAEVWHWDQWAQYDKSTGDKGLFGGYIDLFFKLKEESSGFPSSCRTEEEKIAYIQSVQKHEGVLLNYANMSPNPGVRAIAKLCLNSFWGKFSQRNQMRQTSYITKPEEYFKLLTSDTEEVSNVLFINDEMVRVDFKVHDQFLEPLAQTNIVIAAFTTAHARLELYKHLRQLGHKNLYHDTDSIIFISREGEESREPKQGHYMGELVSELKCSAVGCKNPKPHPDHYISSFVSGGPKNYAYITDNGFTCMKVKGVSLNYRASNRINFDTLKRMIIDGQPESVVVTDPS
jgi:hypothetical protein